MKIYKVVPAVGTIVVKRKVQPDEAVVTYFEIIDRERQGGWEFVTVSSVNVVRKKGRKGKPEMFNAFVFCKEDAPATNQ